MREGVGGERLHSYRRAAVALALSPTWAQAASAPCCKSGPELPLLLPGQGWGHSVLHALGWSWGWGWGWSQNCCIGKWWQSGVGKGARHQGRQ